MFIRGYGGIFFRYGILVICGFVGLFLTYLMLTESVNVKRNELLLPPVKTVKTVERKLKFIPDNVEEYKPTLDLIPKRLQEKITGEINVKITAEEFQKNPNLVTGNPLIDFYADPDYMLTGEHGRGITFVAHEDDIAKQLISKYNLNVYASDLIPVNRHVPNSRFKGCENVTYEDDLPTASIIIPFFDEWPSVLIRTIYSIINRTPRHLLKEILLIDDGSTMEILKDPLDSYIDKYFPKGLVKIMHLESRQGLIKARILGWKQSKGDVIVIFDSHMEVNIDWLQPLVTEIKKDRKTIAMGILDYIDKTTLEYKFNRGYFTRYGFNWKMIFFETYFRQDQIGPEGYSPRPGATMVGAAFAVDTKYFGEIGTYDEGMKIWGGENLEMSWRVWLCGGRLIHLACSHFGHVARSQPYEFPGGRHEIELYNYKRAVDVWMGPLKQFAYEALPDLKKIDAGDISERLALKEKLKCKNMTWYFHNVWPELTVYDDNADAWGSVKNKKNNVCLDNKGFLFQAEAPLIASGCHFELNNQGFSITKDGLFRTTLSCVVFKTNTEGNRPAIEDCIIGPKDKWRHQKGGVLQHIKTELCMDMDMDGIGLVMKKCAPESETQQWEFTHYTTSHSNY